ncbi:hypothetical protein HDF16_004772 [Granulicella aggregans]|uniref:Uncharacterized protein n=1 Tax=Granulicella aggregans TaxID=474949 RepID=A0A7W7ZHT0_9BACT|nr:hypothetical protein [Granulicella aggregans]
MALMKRPYTLFLRHAVITSWRALPQIVSVRFYVWCSEPSIDRASLRL